MTALVPLVLSALLAQQPPDLDVIRLKDGTTRTGWIAEETDSSITLQVALKGSKGETVGLARSTIDKSDIERIDRGSAEARDKAQARAAAFESKSRRQAEAMARIKPGPTTVMGREGLRTVGEHFEIHSSCDERFLREVTFCLEEVFGAYKRFFKVRANAGARVTVWLLADRAEYIEFQRRKFDGAVENPAFYHPVDNYIAAYNTVEKEKARQINGEIAEYKKSIAEFKKKLSELEQEVDRLVRRLREEARSEEEVRQLRAQERAAKRKLEDYRREANREIERCEKLIAHNNGVLREQTRGMFEMLYHEGFHAFARNFLFEGRELPRWLNEGMASYFEMSVVEGGELVHGAPHPGHLKLCRDNYLAGRALPLADVLRAGGDAFVVTHLTNARRSTSAYAQSWLLAHYIADKVSMEKLDRYVADVAGGADAMIAFVAMMGQPLQTIDEALRRHVSAAGAPPAAEAAPAARAVATRALTRAMAAVEDDFMLLLPGDWGTDSLLVRGTIRGPAEPSFEARIACESRPAKERLVDDVDAVMTEVRREHAGAKFTPVETFSLGGREAVQMLATWVAGADPWSALILVVRGPETANVFTFAADDGRFEKLSPTADKIMRSLRFGRSALLSADRRRVAELMGEGQAKYFAGSYAEATALFQRAGAVAGEHPAVEYAVAVSSLAERKFANAASAAQRALALDPANPVFLRLFADALVAQQKTAEAAAAFRRIIESDPRCEEAYLMAAALLWSRNIREARDILRRGAKQMPESAQVHLRWGKAAEELKDYGEALQAYQRVVAIDECNLDALAGIKRVRPYVKK